MTRIYTKKGDKGRTTLLSGERVSKSDIKIECNGSIDELNSFIGFLKSNLKDELSKEFLHNIQLNLLTISSNISGGQNYKNHDLLQIGNGEVEKIENEIDRMESKLQVLDHFIIPGENSISSLCHIVRTVCRRVERNLVRLKAKEPVDSDILSYLNRLADYFFLLSRSLSSNLT